MTIDVDERWDGARARACMLGDLPPSFISCGRFSYSALCRAASTGSMPWYGWQCSKSEYAIMEKENTSTCAPIG
jgi:hypothetical protein